MTPILKKESVCLISNHISYEDFTATGKPTQEAVMKRTRELLKDFCIDEITFGNPKYWLIVYLKNNDASWKSQDKINRAATAILDNDEMIKNYCKGSDIHIVTTVVTHRDQRCGTLLEVTTEI